MSLAVVTLAQMREWERATWATGQTEAAVIQLVGQAVGQTARQLTKPNDLVLIVAGKGHNGDDARAAQSALCDRRVEFLHVADPAADLPKLETRLSLRP